jgi:hypothetical protein
MKPLDRAGVATMLWQQSDNLDITAIGGTPSPFSFQITRRGYQLYGLVLVRSSDYWTKRVHLAPVRPDLLIVWTHDSCVPVETLSLKTGVLSPAYGCPPIEKRNRYTAPVFIGQLLCGLQSAYDALETLPEATKYRYLARVKELTKRPRGRPLKV